MIAPLKLCFRTLYIEYCLLFRIPNSKLLTT